METNKFNNILLSSSPRKLPSPRQLSSPSLLSSDHTLNINEEQSLQHDKSSCKHSKGVSFYIPNNDDISANEINENQNEVTRHDEIKESQSWFKFNDDISTNEITENEDEVTLHDEMNESQSWLNNDEEQYIFSSPKMDDEEWKPYENQLPTAETKYLHVSKYRNIEAVGYQDFKVTIDEVKRDLFCQMTQEVDEFKQNFPSYKTR